MNKIWQKGKSGTALKIIDDYCFNQDAQLDNSLVKYDVYGSISHAFALNKLNIITEDELLQLKKALKEILELEKQGKFTIEAGDEDIHSKVESYLITKLGSLGKKIHTARSRNDQVLVDLRLYSKDRLLNVVQTVIGLAETFQTYAKKYEFIPMPGYTHMQKAMPSSVGLWLGSFSESLLDDLPAIKTAYDLNDQSPLGSGAAYGLSLSVDRQLTADMLGFQKVQNNSLYCQASRPKIILCIIQSLVQVMLTLSRFAEDMLLFTTNEFNFFTVGTELCTGSSIMPQKKNLDIMEHLRAKTQVVINYQQLVVSLSAGLPSGYNSDFIETKGPLMNTFLRVNQSLEIVQLTVKSIQPNIEILKKNEALKDYF